MNFFDKASADAPLGATVLAIIRASMPAMENAIVNYIDDAEMASTQRHELACEVLTQYGALVVPETGLSWAIDKPRLARTALLIECVMQALPNEAYPKTAVEIFDSPGETFYRNYVHQRQQDALRRLGYELRLLQGRIATDR